MGGKTLGTWDTGFCCRGCGGQPGDGRTLWGKREHSRDTLGRGTWVQSGDGDDMLGAIGGWGGL